MNPAQKRFFDSLWYRNLILKSRQMGFTTAINLFILDECLFNDDIEGQIIAHKLEDAQKIFRRKILFPYNNLPEVIRKLRPLVRDSQSELAFGNGSVVSVSTSARSGTAQYLHVSEFGNMCAKYPHKAKEVVTGAIEAVAKGQFVFIESTAEGRDGYFYEYCKEAQDRAALGLKLSELDWRFHFFPWWSEPEYTMDAEGEPIGEADLKYFEDLELKIGQPLTPGQRVWYVKKKRTLGADIKREYPSTPEEAFEEAIEGAYFSEQFKTIRREGRITAVPSESGFLVDTWWDLGMNDKTCIWFTQEIGKECRVIDYYEASGEGLPHYRGVLDERARTRRFIYGKHYAPHDIAVRELGTGLSRQEQALALGINFEIVPRVGSKMDSIEAARQHLSVCWFDESACADGIKRLEGYRKEWDDRRGVWRQTPLHDDNSNGADAFQTLAMGWRARSTMSRVTRRPVTVRRLVW